MREKPPTNGSGPRAHRVRRAESRVRSAPPKVERAEPLDEEPDPLYLFEMLLDRLSKPDDRDDEGMFFHAVVATLSGLAIAENGGDPWARERRSAIYDRLDEALDEARLDATALVLIAKIFADANWRVPNGLKRCVVSNLEEVGTDGGEAELKAALAEIVEAAEGDPFAVYDAISSVLAAFPSETAARMVATIGEAPVPVLLHALSGFAMHRDAQLASAAILELKRVGAAAGGVESSLVERMVRMRPWIPSDRQALLDDAIRALRPHAGEPSVRTRPKTAKCYLLACDNSGGCGAMSSLKADDGWRFVAAMCKPSGVDEVLSLEGLTKAEAEATLGGMRDSVLAAETDVAGFAGYLQLMIGENVASQTPPPYRLIAIAEAMGLGPLAPRIVGPGDLIADLLADLPETERDADALARAHQAVLGGVIEAQWFESGEIVERLLAPIRGAKAREKSLLAGYLPERRAFWTRQCALSAFALSHEEGTHGKLGRSLALVGREIATGAAFESIPLMRQIAANTARAVQGRS